MYFRYSSLIQFKLQMKEEFHPRHLDVIHLSSLRCAGQDNKRPHNSWGNYQHRILKSWRETEKVQKHY